VYRDGFLESVQMERFIEDLPLLVPKLTEGGRGIILKAN
jgi:hypothetical protein